MIASSHVASILNAGVELDVIVDDYRFQAYVVISEPDIDKVAEIVPAERFEADGDVHVAAVTDAAHARDTIEDVIFNMNPNDALVVLCGNPASYAATLEELGLPLNSHPVPGAR